MDQQPSANFFDQPTNPSRSSKSQKRKARLADKRSNDRTSASRTPLTAKTVTQREYIDRLWRGEHAFGIGPAGTGKTYIPARIGARRLLDQSISKIIIVRITAAPNRRHELGFKPGKQDDKLAPWMIPVLDGMRAEVSGATIDKWKNDKKIEFAPFESMRGRTFGGADGGGVLLILDEAQNATLDDLKLVLTRVGENCQVVVTGDIEQIDIHNSGLISAMKMARTHKVPMAIVEFGADDVVRSAFTKAWVKAFQSLAAKNDSDDANLDELPAFLQNGRHQNSQHSAH